MKRVSVPARFTTVSASWNSFMVFPVDDKLQGPSYLENFDEITKSCKEGHFDELALAYC
jgi:hypothetical protein